LFNNQKSITQPKQNQRANLDSHKPRRERHSGAFVTLVFIGLLSRVFAMMITAYAISTHSAVEANPIFYMLSPLDFVIFTLVSLIVLYVILWVVPMSSTLRLFFAFIVTIVSIYDLAHDVIMLLYHEDIPQYLMHHL
jgi:hypothetical protein